MRVDVTVPGVQDAAVYFNGERQTMCVAADDVEGWIDRYERPPGAPGRLDVVRRYGRVRILFERGLLRAAP